MPYPRRFSAKMPDFDDDVTVVDVYDLASDIGKECEIIIEKYGPDAVTALLPKVINALELLENLAVRNEKENQALQELTAKISQLENDKIEKAEYRQRFEKVRGWGHCLLSFMRAAKLKERNVSTPARVQLQKAGVALLLRDIDIGRSLPDCNYCALPSHRFLVLYICSYYACFIAIVLR